MRTFLELDQRRADLESIADPGAESSDVTGMGRGDLDHGLFRLDGYQRLIGDDVLSLADVPGHDLRILEPLAEIGQCEDAHVNAIARCAAATMRVASGR